jgi:surfeit locus 1 family protein
MPQLAFDMKLGRQYRFRPRAGLTLLALAAVVLFYSLGQWQSGRAQQKLALQALHDQALAGPALQLPANLMRVEDLLDRPLQGRGRFLSQHLLLHDNRVHHGRPGYHVLMPLLIESVIDGSADKPAAEPVAILVNRGWIPASSRREQLPEIVTPQGVVLVQGIALLPRPNYALAGDDTPGPVRQSVELARVATQAGLRLQPVILQQQGNVMPGRGNEQSAEKAFVDGLARDWPRDDARVDTHRAYALQWYVMAALTLLAWLGLNLKRIPDAVTTARHSTE